MEGGRLSCEARWFLTTKARRLWGLYGLGWLPGKHLWPGHGLWLSPGSPHDGSSAGAVGVSVREGVK